MDPQASLMEKHALNDSVPEATLITSLRFSSTTSHQRRAQLLSPPASPNALRAQLPVSAGVCSLPQVFPPNPLGSDFPLSFADQPLAAVKCTYVGPKEVPFSAGILSGCSNLLVRSRL